MDAAPLALPPALLRLRHQTTQTLSSLISGHRLAVYGLLSLLLAGSAVVRAFRQYSNFYSAAVYLSRSAGSVLALANLGFFCTLIFGRILQRIFFGPLRASEVERLYDRIWYFLTESLLAFTIFRESFDTPFLLHFSLLLFLKSFHWLLSDRIEWMDQLPWPGPSGGFHVRVGVLFGVLGVVDLGLLGWAVGRVWEEGVGGVVLFGNEYAILLSTLLNNILRYLIITYDIRRAATRGGENAPPWQDKSMWIFYTELFTDFLKLLTYLLFFLLILTFYGLPLNIMREVYLTTRSFITRVRDLIRYRHATRNMDQRYPDASVAELEELEGRGGGAVCIICRDEMRARQPAAVAPPSTTSTTSPSSSAPENSTGQVQERDAQGERQRQTVARPPRVDDDGPNMTPKKLPCGHIFHFQCLRSWLERQQSCPTCRRTVLEPADGPTPAAAAPRAGQAPAAPNALAAANPANPANAPGAPAAPPAAGAALPQPPADLQNLQNLQQPGFPLLPQLMWGFAGFDPALGVLGGGGGLWGGQQPVQAGQGQAQPGQGVQGVQPAATPAATAGGTPAATTPAGPSAGQRQQQGQQQGYVQEEREEERGTSREPLDPRRAAAEAALRRMGIKRAPSAPDGNAASTSTSQETAGLRPTPTTPLPSSTSAAAPSNSGSAQPAVQAPSTGQAPPQPTQQLPPNPLLIPLFSPGAAPLPPLSYTSQHLSSYFPNPASPFPQPGAAPGSPATSAAPAPAGSAASGSRPTLDPGRLSLEEVDETLRTLERLQGVVWESVEELVRVRSRLAGVLGAEGGSSSARDHTRSGRAGEEEGGRSRGGGGDEGGEKESKAEGKRREMGDEDPRRSYYS